MLVAVACSHTFIYLFLPHAYLMQQEQQLAEDAAQLQAQVPHEDEKGRLALVTELATKWHANVSINYAGFHYQADLLNQEGLSAIEANESSDTTVITTTTENSVEVTLEDETLVDSDFLTLNEAFSSGEGDISVTASREHVEEASKAVLSILPLSTALCVFVSILFAAIYSKSITSPIRQMEDAAAKMRRLEPGARSPVKRRDEIGALSKDLNELYDTLLSTIAGLEREIEKAEDADRQRADFLRAASHELKTPVTALSAMLENMVLGIGKYKDTDTYVMKCKVMADRLATMIREMLDASRSLPANDSECSPFSVSRLVSELMEPYLIIAKAKGIIVEMNLSDSSTVQLPQEALRRAISNILSNAVSYTSPGGFISIVCEKSKLVIRNECEPIPPDQLSHIFEPFYRPDFGRSHVEGGNGLGLYIVSSTLKSLSVPFDFSPTEKHDGMVFAIHFDS